MEPEQKAAYVNAMVACAMIEAMGMQAANRGTPPDQFPPYKQSDFNALIEKYGIHHNAIHAYTHQ